MNLLLTCNLQQSCPLVLKPTHHGLPYSEVVLPTSIPKARYIEIDHEHHPPITTPTALERAQLRLDVPMDAKSSAATRVRRVFKAQTSTPPTAGPSKPKKPAVIIDISSDEADDTRRVAQKPIGKGKKRAASPGLLQRLQADEGLTRSEVINDLLSVCSGCGLLVLQDRIEAHRSRVCVGQADI